MKFSNATWLIAGIAISGCASNRPQPTPVDAPHAVTPAAHAPHSSANANPWYRQGAAAVRAVQAQPLRPQRARNVILFIGDGMSLDTITAARIFAGQQRGQSGEENVLAFERLPHTALMKTYTTDLQVPDSAGTATAMLTGVKTKGGVVGVDANVRLGECASLAGARVSTFLEQMEAAGKATGVISTARITHATPAATYAHSPHRDWEHSPLVPPDQRACADIATQLIDFSAGDGIEVVLGGGRAGFFPTTVADIEYPQLQGARTDGADLVQAWRKRVGPAARYVWDRAGFAAVDFNSPVRVLGLFEPSHMEYEVDRRANGEREPSLAAMTRAAITRLSLDDDGYFLLVEGGRIDHAHHSGNAARALHDTVAFDAAVSAALAMINLDETLVLVTADHGHVMSFSGYPRRGNPILGTVVHDGLLSPAGPQLALDKNNRPYTTLSYANGPGHRAHGPVRDDLSNTDTGAIDFVQEATVPLASETHSGTDVIVYADGPGAALMRGVHEQNYVYHVMRTAVGL